MTNEHLQIPENYVKWLYSKKDQFIYNSMSESKIVICCEDTQRVLRIVTKDPRLNIYLK